jgi:hypothetical protein
MIRALFRLLAMFSLAVAVIMAVLDATRTVAAQTLVMTPLVSSWQSNWPDGLASFQSFVEGRVAGFLWDPVITAILSLPGFAIFALIAFLLYAIGRKPERRIGRFVVDE